MKNYLKKFGTALIVAFLFCYMVFIFGPSEIFFSNIGQFEFLFGEYFYIMLGLGLGVTAALAVLLALLPKKIFLPALGIMTGISVAGYAQVMFLNKDLDLLGLNPDGYAAPAGRVVVNTIIWIVVIVLFTGLAVALKNKDMAKKIYLGLSGFLIAIQLVALVSLVIGADSVAFERDPGEWHLSGEKQMMVSGKDNVIVFILDYFSNRYVEPMLAEYPDALDYLNDFTYYDNDECVYHGTFPSIAHMITGQEVDTSVSTDEWCQSIWNSDTVNNFYELTAKKNYEVNFYTPESWIVRGNNDIHIFEGKLDNLSNDSMELVVNKKLVRKTLSKASGYRFAPEILKNVFYTDNNEFLDIIDDINANREHNNYDFYERLEDDGIVLDDSGKNMLSIQHLMGAHAWDTDENCEYKEGATLEETCMGCMTMMKAYLDELKEVGKYDDATIIITSDHGSEEEPQTILFVKKAGETHDEMIISHAPVSHCELLPSIVSAIGGDSSDYGQTFDEINENDVRERTYYLHIYDENYPGVPNIFNPEGTGVNNVYYEYKYTGNYDDLKNKMENEGPDEILQMFDCVT